ncbi:MAG: cadherin-like beta sandwich domain-containing protein, partial [Caldilineaceae bacterium]|nr:cadherin-like beta sandwich domain-containing protein [Caldilineaceae bacterium]
LFYNAPTSEITGSNSLTNVNPLFFDMAADNYRLASASPAIGAALDVGVNSDLDGTARPQLSSFDIGSFEFNACGVTNINDDGPGSLRANLAACPEVVFDAGFFATPRTIQLLSPLTITTDVTVDGARYNVYTPTVQAGSGFRVFTVDPGADATLNRLTITGGRLSGATAATGAGAGIYNAGNLTVTNSVVSGNVASHDTAGLGAGIYNANGAMLNLASTTLASNTAAAGGGLYVSGGAVTLDRAVIATNLVTYTIAARGGGIYVAAGVLTVTNGSVITNNVAFTATSAGASQGGGLYAAPVDALRLISGTIADNTANQGGGIFLAGAGSLDLADVTLSGNHASLDLNALAVNGNGGGIYAANAQTLINGVLSDNLAHNSGGGVYASAALTVTDTRFLSNTAQGTDAGTQGGGGVFTVMTGTITGALFQGNTANVGGGLRTLLGATLTASDFLSNTATGETGAAHIGGAAVITGTDFIGNRASSYGALQVSETADVSNSLFQHNRADGDGSEAGAARIFGTAQLTDVQFISNTAAYAGALQLDGGGWLTATNFISNTAGADGGALTTRGPLEIATSNFEHNQATGSQGKGGAVFVQAATAVTVTASTFLTNTATRSGGALADAASNGSIWRIEDSRFQGNRGGYAGAIAIGTNGSAAIVNSDFVANQTTNVNNGNAGAVYVEGPVDVSDSLFDHNVAVGSAGALHTRGSTQITNTTFSLNRSSLWSGALYVQNASSNAVIASSFFLTNTSGNNAGAVYLEGPGYITATHFISNTANGNGGALNSDAAGVQIEASRFQSNYAAQGYSGGAVSVISAVITDTDFLSNTATWGAGALSATDVMTVTGGRFAFNSAPNGGAISAQGSSTFTNVEFVSNTALVSGGAIQSWAGLDISASRYLSNTASFGGAILIAPATVGVVRSSEFTGNSASQGGAILNYGVITVTGGLLQGNAAGSTGGALYTDSAARTVISGAQILSNTAAVIGGGVYALGPTTLAGGALQYNRCTSGSCADTNGLFAQTTLTVTADSPFTYTDNLNLRGDLVVQGNVTFTAGVATFSVAASGVTTHTLSGSATTAFRDLEVLDRSVLDVGGSVITATGVTTNAGVIHRLAPAQSVTAVNGAHTYDDGVGKPTAVLAQSGGADMGDTTVRVSAHLTTTEFLCNGKPLSPRAAQRLYAIAPANGSNVTADLTLYYLDSATNSEANGLSGANLRIFHCEDGQWRLVRDAAGYPATGSGAYTAGSAGAYNWVTISGHDFSSFSPFAITEIPSTNASLSNLQVFSSSINIPLTPSFAVATTEYTATVANTVVSVTVKPVITQTNATVQVNGVTVISGSASSPIPLVVGANVITTVVTAQDGWTTQTYTVTITRASQSRLSDLQLSAGPINPSFLTTTQAYTVATVPFAVASTLVTATAGFAADPIGVSALHSGGAPVTCTGATSPWNCPLGVGGNVISVTVTAADNTTHVYTVTFSRAGDATLSDLALSAAPINPAPFVSTTLAYTTSVLGNAVAGTLVTPTLTYPGSDVLTVTVAANGGTGAACSAAPYTCPLAVGENVISVTVRAIDNTTQVYTVTVPRASLAQLSGLTVAPGGVVAPLYPTFSAATQAYTMTVVSYGAITASVASTAAFASDPISVVAAPAGGAEATCTGAAPWTCPLAVGQNTISVTVTAADNTTQVYTVTLTRAGDATLSTLEVSAGVLNPTYISTTLAYTTAPVVKAMASTLVTATTTYASDVLTVSVARSGGAAGACAGAASPWDCPLLVGVNVVSVTVTAADNTTQVYTVTVQRLPSDNADLASMDVRNITIEPIFDPATTSYTASVPSFIARVVITPTTVDADATIAVSGTAVISGTASPTFTLGIGDSVITTVVTAENGIVTKSYVLTITRAAPVSPWYVQPDGDNTNPCTAFGTEYACQTIAGAMAKALNGDTIYIAGATYTESLTVAKSLTFIGVNTPTVSGGGVSRVFTITAGADVTMDGLIVGNGWLSNTLYTAGAGAGIFNTGHLTLTRSTVAGNTAVANNGGGIYQTGVTATLKLLDSALVGNTAQQGGGLYVDRGAATLSNAVVSTNIVTNTVAAIGGGIAMNGAGTVVTVTNNSLVVGNRVVGSTSNNLGGGIHVQNGTLWLVDSTLSANHAYEFGGGLYIQAGASHVITHSVIVSNTARAGAGLTTRATAPLTIYNMTIYSNTALDGSAGGVFADPPLTIVGGAIYSNTSTSGGGGVYATGDLTMTNVTVAGNSNLWYGAGVFANANATISGSRFEDNRNTGGGSEGAGLYMVASTGLLTLVDTQFISNTATGFGGGLYTRGTVALSGGEFRGNRANNSPAGSGLYAQKAVTITAGVPYTYVDGFDLRSDLSLSDAFTFTAGAVNFVINPDNPTTVVTHTLRGPALTSFNGLAVVDYAVLDVGSSVVRVTGIFTNAGV